MRIVIQRVRHASVSIEGHLHASIGPGLLVLVGVECGDQPQDADWLAAKTLQLRIFEDDAGKMNRSLREVNGEILVISQFTLLASSRKGNRPGYTRSALPAEAIPLYEHYLKALAQQNDKPVAAGIFGADMQVELTNDGPVTLILDSRLRE